MSTQSSSSGNVRFSGFDAAPYGAVAPMCALAAMSRVFAMQPFAQVYQRIVAGAAAKSFIVMLVDELPAAFAIVGKLNDLTAAQHTAGVIPLTYGDLASGPQAWCTTLCAPLRPEHGRLLVEELRRKYPGILYHDTNGVREL